MNDLFPILFGSLGMTVLSILITEYILKLLNPFYYKISYTNKNGELKVLYIRMIKELSMTSYEEIKENIKKEHPNTLVNIERIYCKKYNNLQLFNKKDYD